MNSKTLLKNLAKHGFVLDADKHYDEQSKNSFVSKRWPDSKTIIADIILTSVPRLSEKVAQSGSGSDG